MMIVNEKVTVKALNEAYKKGYEIVPMEGGRIAIYTENWAMDVSTLNLPLGVSQTLVEHYGSIPAMPMFVQKGRTAQMMMRSEAMDRGLELKDEACGERYMRRIPITFKKNWEMFVAEIDDTLRAMAFNAKYLDIVDWDKSCPGMIVSETGNGVFASGKELLVISPGSFGPEDRARMAKIAELYREQKTTPEEEPENICLFEDMERE